jgi:uncharacterized protein with HEPN domain
MRCMLSEKARRALLDIRDNIALARSFIAGLSYEEFRDDLKSFYAVTRALEIISEASRRLPASFHQKHAALPWKQIMGVGNVYRHDYDNVRETYVWTTVRDHLGPLLEVVEQEIATPDDGS